MTFFLELFNLAILIALIFFSAWSFYLKFKADRVTTIKDLLLAFVTGGALAVATMVFGVSEEIKLASEDIKKDTVSIRATLEEGGRNQGNGHPQMIPEIEQLIELLEVNQRQTLDLRNVLGVLADLQKKSEQSNDEGLAELLEVNQQQTLDLGRVLGVMADLEKNSERTNQLLEQVLAASGSKQEIPTKFSGSQLLFQIDLVCSLRQVSVAVLAPNCIIRPTENVERVQ